MALAFPGYYLQITRFAANNINYAQLSRQQRCLRIASSRPYLNFSPIVNQRFSSGRQSLDATRKWATDSRTPLVQSHHDPFSWVRQQQHFTAAFCVLHAEEDLSLSGLKWLSSWGSARISDCDFLCCCVQLSSVPFDFNLLWQKNKECRRQFLCRLIRRSFALNLSK